MLIKRLGLGWLWGIVVMIAVALLVSPAVMADEYLPGLPDADYGLGISIPEPKLQLTIANPVAQPFTYGMQEVSVKTAYGMGYDLSVHVQSDSAAMINASSNRYKIEPTSDTRLDDNEWGVARDKLYDADGWAGLGGGQEYAIALNRSAMSGSEVKTPVYYGVKASPETVAGEYAVNVVYTATTREPDHPAILRTDRDRYAIDSDDRTITVIGSKLEQVNYLGVDFNSNRQIDLPQEACTDWRIDPNYQHQASCQLPVFDQGLAGDGDGGEYDLLWQSDQTTSLSGHQIAYYYQPELAAAEPSMPMVVKREVGVVDVASTEDSSLVLTDDGEVYHWGQVAPNGDSKSPFNQTLLPMLIQLPDVTMVDRLTRLAAYGDSYLATSVEGKVFAWGNNQNNRLSLEGYGDWITRPTQTKYFGRQAELGSAQRVVAGDGYYAVISNRKISQFTNAITWGNNQFGQLGWNQVSEADKFWPMPGAVFDNSSYAFSNDERYVELAAGSSHVVGLTNYGRVFTWGAHGATNGESGDNRLGFDTRDDARRPHDITHAGTQNYLNQAYHQDGQRFVAVAAGADFSLVLSESGRVYSFGNNQVGQLGNKLLGQSSSQAYDITNNFDLPDDDKIVGISASGRSAAAWSQQGRLFVWGDNSSRHLAPTLETSLTAPRLIWLSGGCISKVALGGANYAVVDGQLWQWRAGQSLTNITNQLTHPSYLLRVTGNYLDRAKLWVDYNNNQVMDNDEQVLTKACLSPKECYIQLSTELAPYDDEIHQYNMYAYTAYSGETHAALITIKSQSPNISHHNPQQDDWELIKPVNDSQTKTSLDGDEQLVSDQVDSNISAATIETDASAKGGTTNKLAGGLTAGESMAKGDNEAGNHGVDSAADHPADSPKLVDTLNDHEVSLRLVDESVFLIIKNDQTVDVTDGLQLGDQELPLGLIDYHGQWLIALSNGHLLKVMVERDDQTNQLILRICSCPGVKFVDGQLMGSFDTAAGVDIDDVTQTTILVDDRQSLGDELL